MFEIEITNGPKSKISGARSKNFLYFFGKYYDREESLGIFLQFVFEEKFILKEID